MANADNLGDNTLQSLMKRQLIRTEEGQREKIWKKQVKFCKMYEARLIKLTDTKLITELMKIVVEQSSVKKKVQKRNGKEPDGV